MPQSCDAEIALVIQKDLDNNQERERYLHKDYIDANKEIKLNVMIQKIEFS